MIQDLGYYPFGNKFFSNLLHYARTGDFVESLIRNAQTVDELAFALGALAHYANDITGHPQAVNLLGAAARFPSCARSSATTSPTCRRPSSTSSSSSRSTWRRRRAGAIDFTQYRSMLDFQVATALLERAFRETYGLEMRDLFDDEERAISTYRYRGQPADSGADRGGVARQARRDPEDLRPTPTASDVVFAYRPLDYEDTYGRDYQKPAQLARFLALVYRLVPKVGPLKPLAFKAPTPEVDRLFEDSLARAHARFDVLLRAVRDGRLDLANTNFDTGEPAHAGDYALADETHAEWLESLAKDDFAGASAQVRRTLDAFYQGASPPDPRDRRRARRSRACRLRSRRWTGPHRRRVASTIARPAPLCQIAPACCSASRSSTSASTRSPRRLPAAWSSRRAAALPALGTRWPMRPITEWCAAHVFGVAGPLVYAGNSADTVFHWVQMAWLLAASIAIATAWWWLDRGRHERLRVWARLLLRLALAAQMFYYGMAKVIPSQFPPPGLVTLIEPVGASSLSDLLWTFVGASLPYQIVTGLRRTAGRRAAGRPRHRHGRRGAGAARHAAGVPAEHGLRLRPEADLVSPAGDGRRAPGARHAGVWPRRSLDVPPDPPRTPPLFRSARANRAALIAQVAFGVYLMATFAALSVRYWYGEGGGRAPKSALYGIWNIEELAVDGEVRPVELNDYDRRWRRVIFDAPQVVVFQRTDDSLAHYGVVARRRRHAPSRSPRARAAAWRAAFAGAAVLHAIACCSTARWTGTASGCGSRSWSSTRSGC